MQAIADILQQSSIDSNYINSLDAISFDGEIVYIDDANKASDYIDEILVSEYVGFDTETKPSFKKGVTYPTSLVQIASDKKAYLFHLSKSPNILKEILPILENEKKLKIGLGIRDDIVKLKKLCSFNEDNFVDLSVMASKIGLEKSNLRYLTALFFNKKIIKSSQTTNWAASELSYKQRLYAATDAWICLKLYHEFLNVNKKLEKENVNLLSFDNK